MHAKSNFSFDRLVLLTFAVLLLGGPSVAEDEARQADSDATEKIARWIQQLDANEFAARSEASRNLQQMGPAACPALAEAAVGESRERRMRALEILGQHFQEGDAATKEAAKEALDKIAASDHEASARRAKELLEPKPEQPNVMLPNIAPAQMQIRINAIAQAGGGVQRIQVNNGVRQMETDDGQRKVKITDDPNKGIEVEITQKKDGKETTEKFQAKNAEELAKKDPEIHKLYQKMQNMGGVQIQAFPGGILPGIPIQGRIPVQAPPEVRRRSAVQLMQMSRRMLENSIQQLEQSKGEGEEAKKVEESVQRLKAVLKQLEEEEGKLAENG
jgi:hypothetical protein